MHYIKKTLLAAAMAAFSLTVAFPAFADEPVGTDVTVVDAGTSDTPEDTAQDVQESQETSGSRETKGHRAAVVNEDEYIAQGPGAQKEEKEEAPAPSETSLGRFTITGYCGCEQCSGGHNLTYSGAVPTPNHTISADLNYFPLGTKLKIDGVVYTVEDKGSSVNGNILDIFYGSHEEALAKGTYTAEVFLVQD
jgi:3D (Asp-Asp-Asp) domain-containing protein